jgi:hypothetical protein
VEGEEALKESDSEVDDRKQAMDDEEMEFWQIWQDLIEHTLTVLDQQSFSMF